MNMFLKRNRLPILALAVGFVGMGLRSRLNAAALDGQKLLVPWHPLEIVLLVVNILAAAIIVSSVRHASGSNAYEINFPNGKRSAVGHFAAGAGILVTMLTAKPSMGGAVGLAWTVLGYASVGTLVWGGISRLRGEKPNVLAHAVMCLFLVSHIISHYRVWSSHPQLEDYVFSMLGVGALTFFTYYVMAFAVDQGNRRLLLTAGLLTLLWCPMALLDCGYPFLYLGGIAWVVCNLCPLTLPEGDA